MAETDLEKVKPRKLSGLAVVSWRFELAGLNFVVILCIVLYDALTLIMKKSPS
jgi:hypothetical protein